MQRCGPKPDTGGRRNSLSVCISETGWLTSLRAMRPLLIRMVNCLVLSCSLLFTRVLTTKFANLPNAYVNLYPHFTYSNQIWGSTYKVNLVSFSFVHPSLNQYTCAICEPSQTLVVKCLSSKIQPINYVIMISWHTNIWLFDINSDYTARKEGVGLDWICLTTTHVLHN